MIAVTLTNTELSIAAMCGVKRRIVGGVPGNKNRAEIIAGRLDYWVMEIESAAAELAVAKHLNVWWQGMSTGATDKHAGDLAWNGRRLQVQWTIYPSGRLLVQETDDPEDLYVLVRGRAPTFEIPGYTSGRQAQDEGYWDETLPVPCYAVPAGELDGFYALEEAA